MVLKVAAAAVCARFARRCLQPPERWLELHLLCMT